MFFDSVTLKKGAWHWWLHEQASKIGFPDPKTFVNFCPYFWLTWLYLLLFVPALIIYGVAAIAILIKRGLEAAFGQMHAVKENTMINRREKTVRKIAYRPKDTRPQLSKEQWRDLQIYGEALIRGRWYSKEDLRLDQATIDAARTELAILWQQAHDAELRRKEFMKKVGNVLFFPLTLLVMFLEWSITKVQDGIKHAGIAKLVKIAQRSAMIVVFGLGGVLLLWLWWQMLVFIGHHEDTIIDIGLWILTRGTLYVAILLTVVLVIAWLAHFLYLAIEAFDHWKMKVPNVDVPVWMKLPFVLALQFFTMLFNAVGKLFTFFFIGFMSWKKDNCPAINWEE